MKVKDKKKWREIQEEWSGCDMNEAVISFAERWATKMEKEFKGTFNHEIALRTNKEEIVIEELTNHMYCCAVHLLANVWVFGEELRQWHNIVRSNGDFSLAIKTNMENGVIYC